MNNPLLSRAGPSPQNAIRGPKTGSNNTLTPLWPSLLPLTWEATAGISISVQACPNQVALRSFRGRSAPQLGFTWGMSAFAFFTVSSLNVANWRNALASADWQKTLMAYLIAKLNEAPNSRQHGVLILPRFSVGTMRTLAKLQAVYNVSAMSY